MQARVAVSVGLGAAHVPSVLPFAAFALHFCEHLERAPTYFVSALPAAAWHFASSSVPVALSR